jgi:hypothetical protein
MALVMQTSILANAVGPGDLPAPACPEVSLFHIHGTPFTLAFKQRSLVTFTNLFPCRSTDYIGDAPPSHHLVDHRL